MYKDLFNQSPLDGPLSCFHFLNPFSFGCYRHSCNDYACLYPCSCPYLVGVHTFARGSRNTFKILIDLPNFSPESHSSLCP